MKAAIGGHAGRAAEIEVAEPDERGLDTTCIGVRSALAEQLLAQLGLEYFVLDVPANTEVDSRPVVNRESTHARPPIVGAHGAEPKERAFWDDVAALSTSGVVLSPNAWGGKPDLVAFAIATVAARYTTPPPDAKLPLPTLHTPPTPRGTPTAPAAPAGREARAPELEFDFATVLESFFEFELGAGLTDVVALDQGTFDTARRAAAAAVVANHVIRDTALKAALGQKG